MFPTYGVLHFIYYYSVNKTIQDRHSDVLFLASGKARKRILAFNRFPAMACKHAYLLTYTTCQKEQGGIFFHNQTAKLVVVLLVQKNNCEED